MGERVLGLQFHLEMSPADIERLAEACANELTQAKHVQTRAEIIVGATLGGTAAQALMERLLTVMESDVGPIAPEA